MQQQNPPSPMRLLEILMDRFGALDAVANSSIKLARYAPEDELAMDLLVAEAVLEFGTSACARRATRRCSGRGTAEWHRWSSWLQGRQPREGAHRVSRCGPTSSAMQAAIFYAGTSRGG
jgi:hypothetical protein